MSEKNAPDDIAASRRELRDLDEAMSRNDPPLDLYTKAIAERKAARLRQRIKDREDGLGSGTGTGR
jgi:hypothetical protein